MYMRSCVFYPLRAYHSATSINTDNRNFIYSNFCAPRHNFQRVQRYASPVIKYKVMYVQIF